MKDLKKFNVLQWDFNRDEIEFYDVLPYFRRAYDECRKKDRPVTREEWLEFVKRKGMYRYWSNANYEFQMSSWPPHHVPEKNKHIKVDAWQQIEANIDVVVDLLMEEYGKQE